MVRITLMRSMMAAVVAIALAGPGLEGDRDDGHDLPQSPSPLPPAETPAPRNPPLPPDHPGSPQQMWHLADI